MRDSPKNAALQLFGYIPESKKLDNPADLKGRVPFALPVRAGVPDLPYKGLLKVTAYVHNRITFCSYQGGSRKVAKRFNRRSWQQVVKPDPNIYILRKTRRQLKIGGRWREKPLATRYTSRAKNMLLDAGQLIEAEALGVGFFLTLTFPGSTENGFEACGIASGYIVDRLNRWLRYRVDNGFFGYVWELQERGAPHLHYMFRMQAGTNFAAFYKEVRQQWRRILLDVSEESGCDLFATIDGGTHRENPNLPVVNFQRIKTRMVGYLAKYASKGRSKGGNQSVFVPGRWWGVSYAIRREVQLRRLSFVLGGTTIEQQTSIITGLLERLKEVILDVWRPVKEFPGPGEFVSLALRGISPRELALSIRDMLDTGGEQFLCSLGVIPNVVRGAPA